VFIVACLLFVHDRFADSYSEARAVAAEKRAAEATAALAEARRRAAAADYELEAADSESEVRYLYGCLTQLHVRGVWGGKKGCVSASESGCM
jgi:hypothetical protein